MDQYNVDDKAESNVSGAGALFDQDPTFDEYAYALCKLNDLCSMESNDDQFTKVQATYLAESLTQVRIPVISSADQMRLLAIIDTVVQIEQDRRAMDANAVRFVLSVRLFFFLQRSLPLPLQPKKLKSRDICWAYHSESQDLLVDFCNNIYGNKLTWKEARTLGMGFWIRNNDTLKKQMEIIARNQFMINEERDPTKCGLLFLAMKKSKLWLNLWKTASNHPEHNNMVKFLSNNFEEERWRSASLKNAFVLLGKQRMEYAATFFLLGEKLRDAVSVCIKQLNDPQLAIVIARMSEGDDGQVYRELLSEQVYQEAVALNDRWRASCVLSSLKQHQDAYRATFEPLSDITVKKAELVQTLSSPLSVTEAIAPVRQDVATIRDISILLLHRYLRENLKRKYRLPQMRTNQLTFKHSKDQIWTFVADIAATLDFAGCPLLAMDALAIAKELMEDGGEQNSAAIMSRSMSWHDSKEDINSKSPLETGTLEGGWDAGDTSHSNKAASLFDDEPPKKQTAASLFDDEPSAPVVSRGLFDDEPPRKSMGLFDDDEPVQKPMSLFDDDPVPQKKMSLFYDPIEDAQEQKPMPPPLKPQKDEKVGMWSP